MHDQCRRPHCGVERYRSVYSVVYSVAIVGATLPVIAGLDPLRLTMFSMALASATLPFAVAAFLVLMNDDAYVGRFCNRWLTNALVLGVTGLAFVVALISVPLELFGG